jgi:hypothetical protein
MTCEHGVFLLHAGKPHNERLIRPETDAIPVRPGEFPRWRILLY